ncbi:unnamed protein product [Urochloa decumbens]|uniref:Uncharacterized protein n=1 Tax=Urochloa decumbens TaxID=240449 RepID=A0ABC9EC31_9POAL
MEAAAAMDFHALSRRELQALCKRNGVRANMTNAAMADALQGLPSVDGIDEIGTTLCLPTPGRSAMKSAAKMAELAGEEQHGSPLPRGRRVSVKSPEAIRMEVEEGEDEMKRDLVKEIVRTPGVALRSTSRRARATPAPLPTPVPASSARATTRRTTARKTEEVAPTPATLRRSQRTAARKAAASVEVEEPAEDVSAARRPTRSARSKMTMALDQEEDVAAATSMQDKMQPEEQEAVASDVKCDDPKEDEVTKLLADNRDEEPEEGEEANSSDVTIGSALASDNSCVDTKMMEEEAIKHQEGIVEEKEPASVERPAPPLATMEDSPILGVLSKAEASEPVIDKAQDAPLEGDEGCDESSPVMEMADKINVVIADKEVSVDEEAIKVDSLTMTDETDHCPEQILPTAAEEREISKEEGLTEVKEGAADKMPQAGLEDDETTEDEEDDHTELKEAADDEKPQAELAEEETSDEDEADDLAEEKEGPAVKMLQAELSGDETSEEGDLAELKESVAAKTPQAELTDDETSEEDEEWASDDAEASEELAAAANMPQAELTDGETSEEDGEWASDDAEASEDIDSTDESDEEFDESNFESDNADMVKMLQGTVIAEDASTEDDDFSGELPPEFDNVAISSDSEAESDITASVLKENQAAVISATKTVVKSLDESAITEEQEDDVPEEADATEKAMKEVDSIVKTLDEFTIKEGEAVEEKQNYDSMSLRKLKTTYKELVIASKQAGKEKVTEGKRLPLEEVDENASVDC